jgi:hypothetical protein
MGIVAKLMDWPGKIELRQPHDPCDIIVRRKSDSFNEAETELAAACAETSLFICRSLIDSMYVSADSLGLVIRHMQLP